MIANATANRDSYEVSTPSETEIRLTRLFDAPRQLVFEVMTKPEHVKEWWGRLGDGYSVPVCEIDLRVGGKWSFVNRHPHGEVSFRGEYREIAPPSRLVFTETMDPHPEPGSIVTAVFAEEGKKTRFTATVKYPSQEVRDVVIASGMSQGAGVSYDRLEDLVARLQRS